MRKVEKILRLVEEAQAEVRAMLPENLKGETDGRRHISTQRR
jgi:hypothetical protein